MKIAVVGAGGVGGVFGARLAAGGREVHFIARGDHLEAIRRDGLAVRGGPGDVRVRPAGAGDRPGDVGPADVVLFCTKLWDMEAAAELARPLVGMGTMVVPLQNGIDARERLSAILGPEAVVGGVAFVNAFITAPGRIEQISPFNRLVFGEWSGAASERCAAFAEACRNAGVEATVSGSVEREIWRKFVLLVAFSSVHAVARGNNAVVRSNPRTEGLIRLCADEVAAVGTAAGIPLGPDEGAQAAAVAAGFPADTIASMAQDLLRGNRLELPWLAGRVVALGAELGVPTPTLDVIHAALLPWQDGK